MIPGIKEVGEEFRVPAGVGIRHPDKLGLGRDLVDSLHHRIIDSRVHLRAEPVLIIRFVQYFPIIDLVVVAGLVPFAQLIGEAALHIPAHQTTKIIPDFAIGGSAQDLAV